MGILRQGDYWETIIIFCAPTWGIQFVPIFLSFCDIANPHPKSSPAVLLGAPGTRGECSPPSSREQDVFWGQSGRCWSRMEGAGAALLLYPGVQGAARSCQWQLLGPQREILAAPPLWKRRDVTAGPGQENPVYPGRAFLDLCVGAFLLEPEELSALPFCENGVGESCAGELRNSLKYFSFTLCWESPALPLERFWSSGL